MLQNREGQRVPNVTFPVREGNTWKKLTSDDLFKNKTVVVFSLPGAFTPTCSSTHLPRYNELAPAFFEAGVADGGLDLVGLVRSADGHAVAGQVHGDRGAGRGRIDRAGDGLDAMAAGHVGDLEFDAHAVLHFRLAARMASRKLEPSLNLPIIGRSSVE